MNTLFASALIWRFAEKKNTKWSGYSWFGNSMREQNSFKPIDRIRVLRIELELACTGGLRKRIFSYTTARASIASHGKLECEIRLLSKLLEIWTGLEILSLSLIS